MGVRNGEDILLAQRCWWGCKLYERHILRRDVTRRYRWHKRLWRIHMYKRYGVWVLYFIYATLLVTIYILCTQKWAGGHTVPSRYGASADTYNCRTYRHIKYLYMVFLVEILFKHSVVDEYTYSICTKMGVAM